MAELRIQRDLRYKVPGAAAIVYQIGNQILVFREKQVNNSIGEWVEPDTVKGVDIDRMLVYVQYNDNDPPNAFGFAQVNLYVKPFEASGTLFADLAHALERFLNDDGDDEEDESFLTEVLKAGDSRTETPEIDESKKKDI